MVDKYNLNDTHISPSEITTLNNVHTDLIIMSEKEYGAYTEYLRQRALRTKDIQDTANYYRALNYPGTVVDQLALPI